MARTPTNPATRIKSAAIPPSSHFIVQLYHARRSPAPESSPLSYHRAPRGHYNPLSPRHRSATPGNWPGRGENSTGKFKRTTFIEDAARTSRGVILWIGVNERHG
jgi:hypothetical protein